MKDDKSPALQVIVLGSGGGPLESNTTAFLVRSVAQEWSKGSIVAVDAGVHLSAIARILQHDYPPEPPASLPFKLTRGPFAGLSLPFRSVAANAGHIARSLVDTYLVTHPHLDHISGLVVNTAGLPGARPKKLAGLPATIQAFKSHVFNNVIWPNLSDENNGAGLLTYLRLVDGGSPALGDGHGRGYLEVCDGLLVKTWGVSHGHCIEKHSHRGSTSSASPRFGSCDALASSARLYGSQSQAPSRSQSLLGHATLGGLSPQFGAGYEQEKFCVYDSSAYFIQDSDHRREVLIFGDVEPDSLSLSPRNLQIWQEAAPKIASGVLAAILIECSYDDSRCDDRLFGHLKPTFVIQELKVLAGEVESIRRGQTAASRKRKRTSVSEGDRKQRRLPNALTEDPVSPKSLKPLLIKAKDVPTTPHLATPTEDVSFGELEPLEPVEPVEPLSPEPTARPPLEGLKIVIIHVKETLDDGPDPGETILKELQEHELEARLGCEYIISKSGQSFYL
ncbi:hypothetical protein HIM_10448 [Hirsutella minnesotensis 3608]|uniref:3',5'-cyclic-nucleotide phosphodiesterase n=1 Tax=Hirsutella minnesotensis 3608 TaxID=1043627 RepID=A0A0F8A2B2_9HYPO|nr:hypothetical protein HIM_10448 [Hirsutella minnesotensis 3608]